MNRFGVKLILSIVSFLAVNIWLIGKGVAKGAADFFISATVEETILFIILQLLVVLIYFIYPLTVKKYKIIYWSVSEALVIINYSSLLGNIYCRSDLVKISKFEFASVYNLQIIIYSSSFSSIISNPIFLYIRTA